MRQVPLTEERVVVELSTSAKPDQLMLGSDVTVPLAAFAAVASSVGETHSFLGTIALACADMYLVKAACARATKAALCARPPAVVLCGAPCTTTSASGAASNTAPALASRLFIDSPLIQELMTTISQLS